MSSDKKDKRELVEYSASGEVTRFNFSLFDWDDEATKYKPPAESDDSYYPDIDTLIKSKKREFVGSNTTCWDNCDCDPVKSVNYLHLDCDSSSVPPQLRLFTNPNITVFDKWKPTGTTERAKDGIAQCKMSVATESVGKLSSKNLQCRKSIEDDKGGRSAKMAKVHKPLKARSEKRKPGTQGQPRQHYEQQ